jgi:hypothetical protein
VCIYAHVVAITFVVAWLMCLTSRLFDDLKCLVNDAYAAYDLSNAQEEKNKKALLLMIFVCTNNSS